jgi:hypothetical protein
LTRGISKSFNFVLQLILISATRSAMSHRPWEESAQYPETPNPVTPTKPPCNAGAGQDNPDAEISECQLDSDEQCPERMPQEKEATNRDKEARAASDCVCAYQAMADRR